VVYRKQALCSKKRLCGSDWVEQFRSVLDSSWGLHFSELPATHTAFFALNCGRITSGIGRGPVGVQAKFYLR
jgi:hypothetical protein